MFSIRSWLKARFGKQNDDSRNDILREKLYGEGGVKQRLENATDIWNMADSETEPPLFYAMKAEEGALSLLIRQAQKEQTSRQ